MTVEGTPAEDPPLQNDHCTTLKIVSKLLIINDIAVEATGIELPSESCCPCAGDRPHRPDGVGDPELGAFILCATGGGAVWGVAQQWLHLGHFFVGRRPGAGA